MSKAIEGAAMLAGAVAIGVTEFALASTGVGIAALPFLTEAMLSLAAGGVAMEAGAIASALTSNRGMNITVRQPASPRQIIYGTQRVGGVNVYRSTTGSSLDQYNYAICIAGHVCAGIQALYLDGRKVWWQGANPAHPSPYYLPGPEGVGFGGEADGGSYEGPSGQQYSFDGLVLAAAYYGTQTAADLCAGFTANDPNWDTTAQGTPYLGGCTWFYLKVEYSPSTFPSTPEIRATVDGMQLYDPRTGVAAFSANSALVVADWLSNTEYGLGIPVNQAQLIAAANVCDEQIALAGGGTESQYQCHYQFDTSTAPTDALATMLKSMGGRISMIGGEAYIWPAYWQGPSANFDESVLTAPVPWDSTAAYKDNCNFVTGTYTAPNFPYNVAGNLYDSNGFDPEGNVQNNFQFGFQPTSFPPYAEDPLHGYPANQWLDEDSNVSGAYDSTTSYALGAVVGFISNFELGLIAIPTYSVYKSLIADNIGNTPSPTSTAWQLAGVNLPLEVSYNMVLSIAQAQRLAKIDLLRRRFWGRGQLEMGLAAFSLQECDVMYFTFPLHGWTEKLLEITGCTFKVNAQDGSAGAPGKPPEIRIVFDVAETDPSIYEWSDTEELTIYDVPGVMQGSSSTPAPPTGLTVISSAATALVGADGLVVPRLEVTWSTPLDGFVTQIQMQYQQVGTGAWLDAGYASVDTNQAFIGPVIAGQQYSVQIRSIRSSGAVSAWDGPVTITAGLTLTIITQSGFGVGSLTASAFSGGTAEIECNPFIAYVGQLALSIFPAGGVTLTVDGTLGGAGGAIAQQTLYYVYYIDPNCLGGNVTPIATTNITDFIGKPGYFLIASIVTPYLGSTTSAPRIAPTAYIDNGSRSTAFPAAAYDNNLSTSADITGLATFLSVGHFSTAFGSCTYTGFPSGSSTSDRAINVILAASCSITAPGSVSGGSVTLSIMIGGVASGGVTLTTTTAQQTYSYDFPAGTDPSTVSVTITATPVSSGPNGTQCSVSGSVAEIYIQ